MTQEKTPAANEFTTSARYHAIVSALNPDSNVSPFCGEASLALRLSGSAIDRQCRGRAIMRASRKARCLKTPFAKRCNLPDSEVLSHPDISGALQWRAAGYGRDGATRKDARTSLRVFSTSRPPVLRENRAGGFCLAKEPETMSTVMTGASTSAAPVNPLNELEISQLYAQAENALSLALFHLRQPAANVPGAARKAVQALSALNALRSVEVAA